MSDLDFQRALRRREPPAGFAGRVLARLGEEGASSRRPSSVGARRPSKIAKWVAAGLAAAVLAAVGAAQFKAYQREADGRRAAQDLTLALRITSEKLQDVQVKLVDVTRQLGEDRHDDEQLSR